MRGQASIAARDKRVPRTDTRKGPGISARAFVFRHELNSYCAVIVTLTVAADFTKFASPL